jgi:hypothetical protein
MISENGVSPSPAFSVGFSSSHWQSIAFQEKRSGIEYYITNHPSDIRLGVYTIGNSTVEEDN